MSLSKCSDCTELKDCKTVAKFQEAARNFLKKDNAYDTYLEADKKVDDCVDFENKYK